MGLHGIWMELSCFKVNGHFWRFLKSLGGTPNHPSHRGFPRENPPNIGESWGIMGNPYSEYILPDMGCPQNIPKQEHFSIKSYGFGDLPFQLPGVGFRDPSLARTNVVLGAFLTILIFLFPYPLTALQAAQEARATPRHL